MKEKSKKNFKLSLEEYDAVVLLSKKPKSKKKLAKYYEKQERKYREKRMKLYTEEAERKNQFRNIDKFIDLIPDGWGASDNNTDSNFRKDHLEYDNPELAAKRRAQRNNTDIPEYGVRSNVKVPVYGDEWVENDKV